MYIVQLNLGTSYKNNKTLSIKIDQSLRNHCWYSISMAVKLKKG